MNDEHSSMAMNAISHAALMVQHSIQQAKSLSNEQIAEIKRLVSGKSTSISGICWMYGITEAQLHQVLTTT